LDNILGLANDALNEHLARRDVLDLANDLASSPYYDPLGFFNQYQKKKKKKKIPDAVVGIAVDKHLATTGARYEVADLFKLARLGLFDGDNFGRDLVLEHTRLKINK